ncbi:hypothetical protein [Chryseobacterium sp. Leaf201]|uniref:hypothetical protein n=1 Tax=Chryseobacterium sp. Leaf201 TaxID=1735672 RepID=UPI000AB95ABC|nr:hypothetical protein [Chryseobacterium sp. Leaf201]
MKLITATGIVVPFTVSGRKKDAAENTSNSAASVSAYGHNSRSADNNPPSISTEV